MRAVTLDAGAAARRGRGRAGVKKTSRRDGVERSRRRRAVNDEEMSTQRFETRAFDAEIERMCDRGLRDALEAVDARLVTAMRGKVVRIAARIQADTGLRLPMAKKLARVMVHHEFAARWTCHERGITDDDDLDTSDIHKGAKKFAQCANATECALLWDTAKKWVTEKS